jgi:hypothetical protein
MVIVDCLTDNNQRTISEVRNCFTKTGAKLGATVGTTATRRERPACDHVPLERKEYGSSSSGYATPTGL